MAHGLKFDLKTDLLRVGTNSSKNIGSGSDFFKCICPRTEVVLFRGLRDFGNPDRSLVAAYMAQSQNFDDLASQEHLDTSDEPQALPGDWKADVLKPANQNCCQWEKTFA